jgi:hypothetical protein
MSEDLKTSSDDGGGGLHVLIIGTGENVSALKKE